ncbi:MAG: hypothetical protein QOE61_4768 [Micromonosporaceae bacterium]|jgi:hypothetical protein|nr:hypothetical protein [Micromonosporaceae bacterium]
MGSTAPEPMRDFTDMDDCLVGDDGCRICSDL